LYLLNIFREILEDKQIRFRGALLDIDDWNEKLSYLNLDPIIIIESIPLFEIIKIINKESHNLSAELLLKTIGKESSGIGTYEAGIEKIKEFLEISGISPENMVIVDGSGLSRFNLISPRYQINLLSWIYRSDYKNELLNSLAVPGENGTLERRMKRSLAEKNVIAKTGSMNNVNNIMGYVQTRDGETLAFSIMMQNFTVPSSLARNLQDLILMRLASFSRK
jgi:D-alanyl-D-alanine carboxypeptidase/D-alanyl-D-alanine-endopeptidase (penicillin-binding protein 4)